MWVPVYGARIVLVCARRVYEQKCHIVRDAAVTRALAADTIFVMIRRTVALITI